MLSVLDRMGKRYGTPPSALLGIDPASPLGLSVNLMAYGEGVSTQQAAMAEGGPMAGLLAMLV